jgi:hypothetical protein
MHPDEDSVPIVRRALDKIERAIAGIFAAIEDGMNQPVMKARMDELERRKAKIVGHGTGSRQRAGCASQCC